MSSLAERVTRSATAVLCGCLLVVGVVTAGLLHARAVRSLDQVLLAAAFAEAHPWQEERFANQHVRSPVEVRPFPRSAIEQGSGLYQQAIERQLPLWRTLGDRRVLLLVVESEDEQACSEEHPYVVMAEAPAVTLWDAALPFLGIYGGVALLTAGLAGALIRRGTRRALLPLERATRELEEVQGLGSHARLMRGGPEEVDQLLASANALLDRLEAAFDAQATFTAQAAHELRTPVTILKGELELALRRERPAHAYRESLRRAQGAVQQLAELVEGLMVLSRVESGQADRGRVVERLSEVVHRAVQREGQALSRAGCAVRIDLSADPEVCVHVPLLTAAIANLLRNVAVHAAGSPVSVEVSRRGHRACVIVQDGGAGLSGAERARVLGRFQRGSTRREGLGLGLPLALEIARRHGGDLILGASALGGLHARLELPEVRPEHGANETPTKR